MIARAASQTLVVARRRGTFVLTGVLGCSGSFVVAKRASSWLHSAARSIRPSVLEKVACRVRSVLATFVKAHVSQRPFMRDIRSGGQGDCMNSVGCTPFRIPGNRPDFTPATRGLRRQPATTPTSNAAAKVHLPTVLARRARLPAPCVIVRHSTDNRARLSSLSAINRCFRDSSGLRTARHYRGPVPWGINRRCGHTAARADRQ